MAHAPDITVHEMPRPARLRNALPVWEVRLSGKRIGQVDTVKLPGARNLFYFAYAVHPDSGLEYRLEGNIDFEERVDVVRRFYADPTQFEQHLAAGPTVRRR